MDTFGEDEDEDEIKDEELDPSFMRVNDINVFTQILAIVHRKFRVASRE